ncbi:MAG: DNA primase [Chloroflexia bacterium]|nr:DNA primase [Chloroflexia bacterium]
MSAIEQVKSHLDIVEVIGQYTQVKKAGRNFKALCPFHQEKTPSFIIFPDSQNYHCFGCGANGDVFTFMMQIENLTFPEALRQLAQRAGVTLAPPTPQEKEADQQRQRLRELNLAAAHFFQRQLRHSPAGAAARSYLEKRGILEQTAHDFLLGYAPDSWEALSRHLHSEGYSEQDLRLAGLVVERDDGTSYDRFRHRLIFPICDRRGHVIGFGGRMLDPEQMPKYLNSPQTPLFDKSSTLYGLDRAAQAIRRQGYAILVEGYFDVLTAHQHGYRQVVAPMGTALTQEQVRQLKRLTQKLLLALDADAAGMMATMRGLEVIREAMDERDVPVPTARGLVRFERELDGEVRIVVLPAGRDPDEVIQADPEDWQERLERARPVLEYVLERLAAEAELDSAKGKAAAVQEALPLLSQVHDPVEQAHYVQRLAQLVQVEERTILAQLQQQKRRSGHPGRAKLPPPLEIPLSAGEAETVEGFLLALLHRFPSLTGELPPGTSSLLAREEHRSLLDTLEKGQLAVLPDALRVYLQELEQRFQSDLQMSWEKARQALEEGLGRLRILNHERQYQQCRYMLVQAYAEGDLPLAQEMGQRLSILSQHRGNIPTPPPSRLYPDLRRHLGETEEPAAESLWEEER